MAKRYLAEKTGYPAITYYDPSAPRAGMVVTYAGQVTSLDGHYLCNGQEVLIADNADLYAAIGTTYNTQINPVTGLAYSAPASGYFRVPDYRSLFLRGAGTNAAGVTTTLGAYQADATAKNGLTATASTSSITGTAASAGAHTHTVSGTAASVSITGVTYGFTTAAGYTVTSANGGIQTVSNTTGTPSGGVRERNAGMVIDAHTHTVSGTAASAGAHTHTVSGTAAAQTITIGDGDEETRPDNMGVNFFIRRNNPSYVSNFVGFEVLPPQELTLAGLATSGTVIINSAGNIPVTLPSAAVQPGKKISIKNINTGIATITPNGSETIDGSPTKTMSQYDSLTLLAFNGNWSIL